MRALQRVEASALAANRAFCTVRAASQRFLDLYPGDEDAPYALYLMALSFYDQIDEVGRDRRIGRQTEQVADAGDGGVAVLLGVLAEQLVGGERAVGPAADDVGEGAAAVDPELPARLR